MSKHAYLFFCLVLFCGKKLFPNGDQSSPPALTVLPEVIKKNKRTILAQGSLDAILFMDGTKLALQ